MMTLNDSLIELVDGGLVEPKEAYMKATDKTGFTQALRARGHDTSFIDGDATPAPSATKSDNAGAKTPPPRPGYGAKR
jgi:hypothetical protein